MGGNKCNYSFILYSYGNIWFGGGVPGQFRINRGCMYKGAMKFFVAVFVLISITLGSLYSLGIFLDERTTAIVTFPIIGLTMVLLSFILE